MDKWYERKKLISENEDELNNKLRAIDIECNNRLNANEIKYDTEEQKNYIDY